jgi:hypothetical protein
MSNTANINSGFWIGDFGLLIPEFTRLPAIESVAVFLRIDINAFDNLLHIFERLGLTKHQIDLLRECCFEGVNRCAAPPRNDSRKKSNVKKCSKIKKEASLYLPPFSV